FSFLCFSRRRRSPSSALLPYTTLFRSAPCVGELEGVADPYHVPHEAFEDLVFGIGATQGSDDVGKRDPAHSLHGEEQTVAPVAGDRKSTRLNSSHVKISYAVFCLKKKT